MSKRNQPLAVGVDVGSRVFHVAVHGEQEVREFENSIAGRKALVRHLKKRRRDVRVVLESTGVYGLELALLMHEQKRFTVFYVNPMAAKAYASRGLLRRAKCDRIDALALARMAGDDLGNPWSPPKEEFRSLRWRTRRIRSLVKDATREKNRLSAAEAGGAPADVVEDLRANITAIEVRIQSMRSQTIQYARGEAGLEREVELLCSIPGIAEATAVEVLGELCCMPSDMTPRQLVAQAGLDPRTKQSGRLDAPRHISKMGSKYLRATLHMASINSARWCPEVGAFYKVLTEERRKHSLVARVAIARKLLHCMHGMLKSGSTFDASRFYNPRVQPEVQHTHP